MIPFVPPTYMTIFYALIGVWALAYAAGLIFGKTNEERTRRIPIWTKLVMIVVVLVIGGIGWLVFARGSSAEPYARWIFFGLMAGAIGDLILAGVFPIKKPLIAGMGVFGIGHLFYLLAIFSLRSILYINEFLTVAPLVIPSLFVAVLLWEYVVRNPFGDRRVNTAAFFYGMLFVTNTVFAVFFGIRSRVMILLGVGMVLFLISDMLLAQVAIRKKGFRSIHDVVWILYSSGQLLIALSIGEAAALLS